MFPSGFGPGPAGAPPHLPNDDWEVFSMSRTTLFRLAAGALVALSLGGCYYPYGGYGWHHHGYYGGPGGPPPPPPPHYYWR
ncbi:hypothetical protein Acid7E03_10280 [Acidisoma sp. 7E03]